MHLEQLTHEPLSLFWLASLDNVLKYAQSCLPFPSCILPAPNSNRICLIMKEDASSVLNYILLFFLNLCFNIGIAKYDGHNIAYTCRQQVNSHYLLLTRLVNNLLSSP